MRIIDSHTAGEPTRTIVEGGPDLGQGTMAQRRKVFAEQFDHIRTQLIDDPRGSAVMVGALLCPPHDPDNTAGVIFFNNAGYLGMCGHGIIGVMVTLYHLGKIALGEHRIETPVGIVNVVLSTPNKATLDNVASYRFAKDVPVALDSTTTVKGDIAWGGNWFFLVKDHGLELTLENTPRLLEYTSTLQRALFEQGIRGADDAIIDHVELFAPPQDKTQADSRNFVLCPGREYDRSPCGTGTSAKMACLYEDGLLLPGKLWRQQSIIGSLFEGSIRIQEGQIIPTISAEAYVTMDTQVLIHPEDPFKYGI